MLRLKLSKKEKEELKELRRRTNDPRSEKALAVLLAGEGRSSLEVSELLKRHYNTIKEWLKRYRDEGIKGLSRKATSGRPSTRSDKLIPLLESWLQESPEKKGYQSGLWTVRLIITEYKKVTGEDISEDTVERALKDAGFSFKRPKKGLPPSAPSKEKKLEQVKSIIQEIEKAIKASKREVEIFTLDESHFSTEPYLIKGWYKKGEHFFCERLQQERKLHNVWCVQHKKKTFLLEKQ
jgi:putative transposase